MTCTEQNVMTLLQGNDYSEDEAKHMLHLYYHIFLEYVENMWTAETCVNTILNNAECL